MQMSCPPVIKVWVPQALMMLGLACGLALVPVAAAEPTSTKPTKPAVSDEPKPVTPKETISLFNGRDLSGFYVWLKDSGRRDPQGVFTVRDGVLRISAPTTVTWRPSRPTRTITWCSNIAGVRMLSDRTQSSFAIRASSCTASASTAPPTRPG